MLQKLFPVLFLIVAGLAASAVAQDGPMPVSNLPETRGDSRPNLLAALGLSPEQVRQIRKLNAERRPRMQDAQRRLFEANRALDAAIYADVIDEAEVQAKLKDFQLAQAEVAKLRFTSELAVRKILTPEQLLRFRDLRSRFAETRQNLRQHRRNLKRRPNLRPVDRQAKPFPNE